MYICNLFDKLFYCILISKIYKLESQENESPLMDVMLYLSTLQIYTDFS